MPSRILSRAHYRLSQVWHRYTGRIPYELLAQAQALIGPACWALFVAMPRGDRIHALSVFQCLSAETENKDLLTAALLHDVGKTGVGLNLLRRTLCVLFGHFWPSVLERMGSRDEGWRRPFYRHLYHAELGAQACERCGCNDTIVWLVRHHEDSSVDEVQSARGFQLQALQQADDRS